MNIQGNFGKQSYKLSKFEYLCSVISKITNSMIGTGKNHELRIESVSWHGHQVVFTYDATAEQCRHICVECNGSVLLHLVENESGNFNLYRGGQSLGELMTDWEHFKPEWALTYVNPRDLDGWRQ